MKRKIRVLHYIPGFKFGGIESRFMDIYNTINHEDFQFDIMISTTTDNPLLNTVKKNGGNVYLIPPMNPKKIIQHVKAINLFFENNHYDIVHCYSPIGYFVLKSAKKNNIQGRILHARTSSFGDSSLIWIRNILKKLTRKQANIYLSVSKPASEWLFKKSDRVEILKNSVSTPKFKFDLQKRNKMREKLNIENQFLVGNVGRYTDAKNHSFTLKVFQEILKIHPNSKLLLVGCVIEDIKEEAIELNIIDNIIALGYKVDVNPYYQSMDALLFPSLYEGLPGALIEAQVSGLKCFVSTEITKEVDITPKIYFLNLNKPAKEWALAITNKALEYNRFDQTTYIKDAGFDLTTTTNRLENIYKSILRVKT